MPLRFVRIRLENGREETIATRLPRDEFSKEWIVDRKYPLAMNRSFAIGALKNDMIYCFLVYDSTKKEALLLQLYKDILRHVESVRPGRHYPRHKGRYASKYPLTQKRFLGDI